MAQKNRFDEKSYLNNKYKRFIVPTACVLLVVFICCIWIYYSYDNKIQMEESLKDIDTLDDHVSPDSTNQAVSLEIQRIHKKGLESLIRSPGKSWKKQPTYYFAALLNDAEWISHTISTWDTGYVGWEVHRFVEDETETIPMELSIYEEETSFRKTTDILIEHIEISYDFRTGRWYGDDSQNDSDGYGHYNGKDYEIWFSIYQTDNDGDGIPYWTEVHDLGTNPFLDETYADPDEDGIPTTWEWMWGYDPFCWDDHANLDPDLDGLDNIEEYHLRTWHANPFHQEIFIEVDFMEPSLSIFSNEHVFWKESQWMLMDVFSVHNISIHIDDGWPDGPLNGGGQMLPYVEEYIDPFSGRANEYYKHYFSDDRKGSFHYIFICHSGGWCFPQTHDLFSDVISIPSNPKFFRSVFFPPAITPRLQRLAMAVSVMHELGHSLNLNPSYHQGIDNASQVGRNSLPPLAKLQERIDARQYWTSYESIMNYHKFGLYVFDYSDGSHGTRDANDWQQIDLTYFQRIFDEDYDIKNKG